MVTRERARDRGLRQAARLRAELGAELRDARLMAGLTQSHVARVAGLSQPVVSRTERARRSSVTIDELAAHLAALGLRLSIRAYPDGPPVRDAAHLHLLRRFRAAIGPRYAWQAEAPIGRTGDLRAWDVALRGPVTIGVDAETRLHDIQALQRRVETKARDSGVQRVVLVVADTRHDRHVVREHAWALATTLPLTTDATLAALRDGADPGANGLVLL